jgi:hypothetical protein
VLLPWLLLSSLLSQLVQKAFSKDELCDKEGVQQCYVATVLDGEQSDEAVQCFKKSSAWRSVCSQSKPACRISRHRPAATGTQQYSCLPHAQGTAC